MVELRLWPRGNIVGFMAGENGKETPPDAWCGPSRCWMGLEVGSHLCVGPPGPVWPTGANICMCSWGQRKHGNFSSAALKGKWSRFGCGVWGGLLCYLPVCVQRWFGSAIRIVFKTDREPNPASDPLTKIILFFFLLTVGDWENPKHG